MPNNVILVTAVIVSLAIGAGGAYIYTSSEVTKLAKENDYFQKQNDYLLNQVTTLSSEKNQLQNQVNSLTEERTTFLTQISSLSDENKHLLTQVSTLTSENTDLVTSIDLLAETIDAMHSGEYVQRINYNITAGTVLTQYFVLDKYGIIWETVVDFTGTSARAVYYYWYEGVRHYVISYRSTLGDYYEYLYETIQLDISPDWKGGSQIWMGYNTRTQFPNVSMSGNMFVYVTS